MEDLTNRFESLFDATKCGQYIRMGAPVETFTDKDGNSMVLKARCRMITHLIPRQQYGLYEWAFFQGFIIDKALEEVYEELDSFPGCIFGLYLIVWEGK